MADEDAEHLRLLSIFHYVAAAMTGLMSLLPCIHLVFGILIVRGEFGPGSGQGPAAPPAFGWFFIVLASLAILMGLTFSVCLVIAGRSLAAARRPTFCLVTAALSCLFVPVGTVLGVFTILVLNRESVKARFREAGG